MLVAAICMCGVLYTEWRIGNIPCGSPGAHQRPLQAGRYREGRRQQTRQHPYRRGGVGESPVVLQTVRQPMPYGSVKGEYSFLTGLTHLPAIACWSAC